MSEKASLEELQDLLGYRFSDTAILARALVHRSLATESDDLDNETYEFLGDAVLDLVVSDMLMQAHPELNEGQLSRLRASVVNARHVTRVARRLGLGRWMRLGKGEEKSGGRDKERILSGCYEAVIGAVFLDGGYKSARNVVRPHFDAVVREGEPAETDYKTELQELTQRVYKIPPSYRVTGVTGPDHARLYKVEIGIAGKVLGTGEGTNRKSAEQMAAKAAFDAIEDQETD